MFYYNINQNMKANTVYILIHGNTEIDFLLYYVLIIARMNLNPINNISGLINF